MISEELEINSLKNIYVYILLWEALWMPSDTVPHLKGMSREEEGESGDEVSPDLILFWLQTFTQTLGPFFPAHASNSH